MNENKKGTKKSERREGKWLKSNKDKRKQNKKIKNKK
jgi:hypothetical protein